MKSSSLTSSETGGRGLGIGEVGPIVVELIETSRWTVTGEGVPCGGGWSSGLLTRTAGYVNLEEEPLREREREEVIHIVRCSV